MFLDPICCIGIFLLVVIVYYSLLYIKHKKLPPGPLGIPIFGYLPFLDPAQPHITLSNLSKKFGPIYGLYLGSVYTVVLCDDVIVREALKRETYTGRAPLFITHGIMGGYGIICAEGALWKDQRKLSINFLKQMGMTKYGASRDALEKRISYGAQECAERINNELLTSPHDPFPILHHAMGNVINDLVFGITYDKDDETWKYLQHLQEEGVKHIGVSGVVNFLPFLRFLPHNRRIIKFLLDGKQKTHKIYNRIIAASEALINSGQFLKESESNILNLYLKERKRRNDLSEPNLKLMKNAQLRHLLADLFGAGVDTTLTTLRWILFYVATNNTVQNNLQKEFDNLEGTPTLENYDNLHYFKACIAESQRIRPVVPLGIPHGTTEETELCGYKIPKNTMVIPLQWALHMNENIWQNPEQFNPQRFIDDDGKFVVPNKFLPFQTGKRMCLGDELAKMLLYIFAGTILYHYEISLDNDITTLDTKGTCGITLTPPNYELNFKRITRNL